MPAATDLELFARIADMTDTMVFVTDLEANSLWVNDTLVRTTGYTLDDYRFQRFENPYIPAEDVQRVTAFLTEFLASGREVSEGVVRNRFVDRWGGTLHVRTRVARIEWEGQPALLYSTTLEQREGTSTEAEARYRSLVEAASDAIVRLRPDLTVHFSNRPFQQLVGLDPVQLRTVPFPDLVAPTHRDELAEQLRATVDRSTISVPVHGRDGGERWLEGTVVRITEGVDRGLLQGILRDSTERRRVDAQLQVRQKRESLGELAGGIAHDLNNILTGILGSASLAQTHTAPGSEAWRALSDVQLAAERAGQLSSSMLAYAGEGNAAFQPVDLAALVREMRPLVASALGSRIALRIDAPDEPLPVEADEVQLRQVVMNLIVNACDATDGPRGTVRVRAGRGPVEPGENATVQVGPTPTGEVVFVEVVDEGRGMNEATARRIFEPFYSTKGKGRGLGLAAVLGILHRHGGGATVASSPERGTTMRIWLPSTDASLPEPLPVVTTRDVIAPTTVLVVDDEPMIRRLAHAALEPHGYTVVEAGSGEEALALVDGAPSPPSVVVLDQTMPGMGGDRTLAELRARWPHLPVVRTSGYTTSSTPLDDAHTTFLGKPYGLVQLAAAVSRALESSDASEL
jgi:PAS domain S-box-containing protein